MSTTDTRFTGVRSATPDDIDALYLFVPMILGETSILPLSMTKIEQLIERCAHRRGGAIAGIIDGEDGAIDASIGLVFTDSETSDEPYIQAAWCGLHPSVRRRPTGEKRQPHLSVPREHYGRRLFEFARWVHGTLEQSAGHPIFMRFDVLTLEDLAPKMGLYQRNLTQIGACFAFGASGTFKAQQVAA